MMEWVTFCKRTEDPKLCYYESRLDEMGIPHRRNGESWHAPILEVPADRHAEAYALFREVTDHDNDGNPIYLDDIPDDDPMFDEYAFDSVYPNSTTDDTDDEDPFLLPHQGADY